MSIGHKLLVWMGIIGIALTIIFECVLSFTLMAIRSVDYQTSLINKSTAEATQQLAAEKLKTEKARQQAYRSLK